MTPKINTDILIPAGSEPAGARPHRSRLVAFVPITVALLGVGAILFGGISARPTVSAASAAIDPIETGSISK